MSNQSFQWECTLVCQAVRVIVTFSISVWFHLPSCVLLTALLSFSSPSSFFPSFVLDLLSSRPLWQRSDAHPPDSALAAELGELHRVLGSTLVTELALRSAVVRLVPEGSGWDTDEGALPKRSARGQCARQNPTI